MLRCVMIIVFRIWVIWKRKVLVMLPIVVKLIFIISILVLSRSKVLTIIVSVVVVFLNLNLKDSSCVKSVRIIVLQIYLAISLLEKRTDVLLLEILSWKLLMVNMCLLMWMLMWHTYVIIIVKLYRWNNLYVVEKLIIIWILV